MTKDPLKIDGKRRPAAHKKKDPKATTKATVSKKAVGAHKGQAVAPRQQQKIGKVGKTTRPSTRREVPPGARHDPPVDGPSISKSGMGVGWKPSKEPVHRERATAEAERLADHLQARLDDTTVDLARERGERHQAEERAEEALQRAQEAERRAKKAEAQARKAALAGAPSPRAPRKRKPRGAVHEELHQIALRLPPGVMAKLEATIAAYGLDRTAGIRVAITEWYVQARGKGLVPPEDQGSDR